MPRTVAIVGRPNVGKSALFNRLAGRKIAIVHDQPGVTRDRISAVCKLGSAPFTIFDTGGIGADVDTSFTEQVRTEAEIAIETSDVIVFVVDGQEGLVAIDEDLARRLRRARKPLVLAVNKIDHPKHGTYAAEFARLGFEHTLTVSAEHDLGIRRLVEELEALLPPPADESTAKAEEPPLRIAIVGRPNVGKSSLTNAILGDERTLVSPISGTTRDAVDIACTRGSRHYVLIDTAGIRPPGKRDSSVEVFSVMRSEASIRRADLCCLVVDATAGVTAQDKKIAGLIQEARKPCLIAVNKWDLIKEKTADKESLKAVLDGFKAELFFASYAPVLLLSAKTGEALDRVFKTIEKIRSGSNQRISTGPLNRLIEEAMAAHPPGRRAGRRFKVLYSTQPESQAAGAIPNPEIVMFVNDEKLLDESYHRYLDAQVREHVPYVGLPLLIRFRSREPKSRKAR
jgi:GTP-binding protein